MNRIFFLLFLVLFVFFAFFFSLRGGNVVNTVTHTLTVTETVVKTVTAVRVVEPVFISVFDRGDTAFFNFSDVVISVANVTGPYSFLQSVLGARLLGARVDVVVGFWGSVFADLDVNGYLQPLNIPGGVVYRGRVIGLPLDFGVPLVLCRGVGAPGSLGELLNYSKSGKLAVVADPVVLSSVVYSVGGSYFNGSVGALISNTTVGGFRIVAELLRGSLGNPFNYTEQRALFDRGAALCILDIWWLSRKLPEGVDVGIFYNKSLAYVKAAFALSRRGAQFLQNLTVDYGGFFAEVVRRVEPIPVYKPGIYDPLLPGVSYAAYLIYQGVDPQVALEKVVSQLK